MNSQNKFNFIDHYVNVKGYQTRYWDVGFSDSVVILVHGFALSCELWRHNIEELSKSHRVIALDYWGSGKTDASSNKMTLEEYPEFLIWFMDALKIKNAKVVGHSLGGLLVMKAAYQYPEYIDKILLVGSAGFTKKIPFHFRLFSLPFLGEFMLKPNRQGLQHAFGYNLYSKENIPLDYVDALFEFSKKPKSAAHALNMARSGINLMGFKSSLIKQANAEARQIQCPVMIIWGKNDRILHYHSVLKAKKLIPHAEVVVLDRCGHIPQMEYPEKFNELAHSFL